MLKLIKKFLSRKTDIALEVDQDLNTSDRELISRFKEFAVITSAQFDCDIQVNVDTKDKKIMGVNLYLTAKGS